MVTDQRSGSCLENGNSRLGYSQAENLVEKTRTRLGDTSWQLGVQCVALRVVVYRMFWGNPGASPGGTALGGGSFGPHTLLQIGCVNDEFPIPMSDQTAVLHSGDNEDCQPKITGSLALGAPRVLI